MVKETKFATFIFENSDKDLINILAEHINTFANVAFDFFEIKAPNYKVKIHIIPTKAEYDVLYKKTYNKQVKDWMIGNYNREHLTITYLSLHDFKNTSHKDILENQIEAINYYKQTIFHEFVHYVNDIFTKEHNCSETEKFLREGIAIYLSKQNENKKTCLTASVEDLLDKEKSPYDDYYLITKYFVENYNKDYILQIFQSNRQSREFLKQELYDKAKNDLSIKLNLK